MNVYYRSKIGEVKTYEQWREWAIGFYEGLVEEGHIDLPDDWMKRLTRVLKLEIVEHK